LPEVVQKKNNKNVGVTVYSIMRSPDALKMGSALDRQIIRVLNGQAFSLGKVKLGSVSGWARMYQRALLGLPTPNVREQVYESESLLRERHVLLATILGWRDGSIVLPARYRRCRQCAKFFQVESRATRLYCDSDTCGAYYRMKKKRTADRERKLATLQGAWNMCREPDRKFKAARKAGVKLKFVSDAIRRGELRLGRFKKGKNNEI
jgi:hypothetical protein